MRTRISIVTVSFLLAATLSSSALAASSSPSTGAVGQEADSASLTALTTKTCADPSAGNLAKMKAALDALAAQPGGSLSAAEAAKSLASCAAAMADANPAGAVAVGSLAADVLLISEVLAAAQGQAGMVSAIKADLEAVLAVANARGIATGSLSGQLDLVAAAELTAEPTAAGGGTGGALGVDAPFSSSAGVAVSGTSGRASPVE